MNVLKEWINKLGLPIGLLLTITGLILSILNIGETDTNVRDDRDLIIQILLGIGVSLKLIVYILNWKYFNYGTCINVERVIEKIAAVAAVPAVPVINANATLSSSFGNW